MSKALQDHEISKRILDFHQLPESEDVASERSDDFCEQLYQEKHYRLATTLSPSYGKYMTAIRTLVQKSSSNVSRVGRKMV